MESIQTVKDFTIEQAMADKHPRTGQAEDDMKGNQYAAFEEWDCCRCKDLVTEQAVSLSKRPGTTIPGMKRINIDLPRRFYIYIYTLLRNTLLH